MINLFRSTLLIFTIIFAAIASNAKEKCDDIKNQSILGLEDTIHNSILQRPECKKLKNIWDNRSSFGAITSSQINKYSSAFMQCQEGLYKTCNKSQKSISEKKLISLFEEFKKDPYLRMPEPASQCLQRAFILSEKLAAMGYKVQSAKIESPTIVGLVKDKNGKIIGMNEYSRFIEQGHHIVVSIDVKLENGKTEQRILDPQYADNAMTVEEYSKKITGDVCSEKPSRKEGCKITYGSPVHFTYENTELERFINGNLKLTDHCGFNILKEAKENIDELNVRSKEMWDTKPLKPLMEDMPEDTVRQLLQIKNLEDKIVMIEDAINLAEDAILNGQLQSTKAAESAINRYRKKIQELQHEIVVRKNN